MTRRTLTCLFALEAAIFGVLVFALLDRRAHQADPSFGINQWGYRGEARAEREPGEIRIALIGGSAAHEAGTALGDTMGNQILYQLEEVGRPTRQAYSLVNLSEPRAGADTFAGTLRRYDFLDPDVVCVFDGYDTLAGSSPHSRERSLVFGLTGYLPILPARMLGQAARLSDPDQAIVDVLQDGRTEPADVSCAGASQAYCAAMTDTVRFALQRGHPIVVASPPFVSSRHATQQRSLAAALTQTFGADPRFMYLDLGSAIDLANHTDSPDGIHRTVVGNHEVGQRIAVGVLKLMEDLKGTKRARGRDLR